ncbi:helix-turn-helix domain-containing protein [Diaphorobacter aerolatus]|uniref:Helix-turn-helix transcriptional regulator n=1 Tax=Diaphorobacter aerolatus TaxID=1288495 RepID=A0A7H0GKF0_9BURK|nr:helix-turn-helix transcriptional regulator [Diaphorobacter aerolatus]QNP48766.1 helix-turn-helix transcriptional regulator [Diaphorobacter aerolatus]
MNDALIDSLVAARKAQQITQAQLAERAGLSRMAVQRTETGDVDPRYSTLAEMSRVLGMELMAVPANLVPALQAFVQSGGKFLGQPSGADAPPSVVEQFAAEPEGRRSKPR